MPAAKKIIKLTKMIYIASPYTSRMQGKMKRLEEKSRCLLVDQAIGQLQDRYPYAFIGPITQSARTVVHMKTQKTTFEHWEIRDLTYVSRCDELWVLALPGWDQSVGVLAEIDFAYTLNLPVQFVNPETLEVKPITLK